MAQIYDSIGLVNGFRVYDSIYQNLITFWGSNFEEINSFKISLNDAYYYNGTTYTPSQPDSKGHLCLKIYQEDINNKKAKAKFLRKTTNRKGFFLDGDDSVFCIPSETITSFLIAPFLAWIDGSRIIDDILCTYYFKNGICTIILFIDISFLQNPIPDPSVIVMAVGNSGGVKIPNE